MGLYLIRHAALGVGGSTMQHFAFVPTAAVTDTALADIDIHILAYLGTLGFEEGFGGYVFQPMEDIARTLHYSCEQVVAALTVLVAYGYVEPRQALVTFDEDGRTEERTVYRTSGISP